MIILVMGVAGSGKTTVGRLLARELSLPFHDADDFHPPANVDKMRRGIPLTDADRERWLAPLQELIAALGRGGQSAVIACSALKQAYRQRLLTGQPDARLVYLQAAPELVRRRLAGRPGHFFNPELLANQFATLEEPADALTVAAADPPLAIVQQIRQALRV